jgi:hypothetical protein
MRDIGDFGRVLMNRMTILAVWDLGRPSGSEVFNIEIQHLDR